ncbi:MAG: hypothetical protein ACEY3B_01760 [Wolbachia sp.]
MTLVHPVTVSFQCPYDVIPVPRHWFLSKRVSSQCPDTGIQVF